MKTTHLFMKTNHTYNYTIGDVVLSFSRKTFVGSPQGLMVHQNNSGTQKYSKIYF
jgi:hypothetical protein